MQFKLTLDMDNAAFRPMDEREKDAARAAGVELAHILRTLAGKVEDSCQTGDMIAARDSNGNTCGTLQITR